MTRKRKEPRRRGPRRKRKTERYKFTKADCRKGYQAALERAMQDWDLLAWFTRRIMNHYKRGNNGEEKSDGGIYPRLYKP
jgi:hypothetical protein